MSESMRIFYTHFNTINITNSKGIYWIYFFRGSRVSTNLSIEEILFVVMNMAVGQIYLFIKFHFLQGKPAYDCLNFFKILQNVL